MVCKIESSSWSLKRDLEGIGLHFSLFLAATCWRARPTGSRCPTMPAASSPTSCLMGQRPGASVNPSGRRWRSACGQRFRAGTSTHGEISTTGAEWGGWAERRDRTLLPSTAWPGLAFLLALFRVSLTEVKSTYGTDQEGTQLGYTASVHVPFTLAPACTQSLLFTNI